MTVPVSSGQSSLQQVVVLRVVAIFLDCFLSDEENNRPEVSGGGVMVQSVNHATGLNSWKLMPPNYDYNQELARAAFADMLHDSERNQLYYRGLEAAIK